MQINWANISESAKNLASRVWEKIQAEPVIVRTVLALAVSGGYLEISDKTLDTVNSVVIVLVLLFGAASARGAVSPLPKNERKPLVVGRKKGSKNGRRG